MSDLSYQSSSSEEEEFKYESYELPQAKDDIQIREVTLSHHHLGDCTDLEAGTLICNGETMELHDGSFLMITELRESNNGHSVTFDGYIFRPFEDLKQYLHATFGGTEVVWLCEAKEHAPKPEGSLRSASSKDDLRIRHLVVIKSDYVADCPLQSQAIGMFTDTRSLVCQWMLVAELSNIRCAKISRICQSIEKSKGSQGLPKAFTALSSEGSIAGGIAGANNFYFQHHLANICASSLGTILEMQSTTSKTAPQTIITRIAEKNAKSRPGHDLTRQIGLVEVQSQAEKIGQTIITGNACAP